MKKLLISIFIFGLCVFFNANGQKVSSSCAASDSIRSKYLEDAYRLTLRRIENKNYSYKDSVIIPHNYADTALRGLIAVFNAKSLPAVDTITKMYFVHSFKTPYLNEFSIGADSSLSWMKNFRKGITPTGNHSIDSLVGKYNLKLSKYEDMSSLLHYDRVRLTCDSNYNTKALTKNFSLIPGVKAAQVFNSVGDGDDITDTIYADHIELIYSIGWGDCPAGCIFRRYWKFNVYWDCSVTYQGSYGNKLSLMQVKDVPQHDLTVYPNPFKDKIYVRNFKGNCDYSLFNIYGQKISSGALNGEISGLENLEKGIYFLQVSNNEYSRKYKIINQ